jgi:hypothetical protein
MMLKKWTDADPATGLKGNYIGPDYSEFLIFLGRNRDSSHLANSNFEVGLDRLGGESTQIQVITTGHWACGWVALIGIHKDARDKIELAEKMYAELQKYPVLDEEDFSKREWEAATSYWEALSNEERKELAVRYECTLDPKYPLSIPRDDDGSLFDMLRGD